MRTSLIDEEYRYHIWHERDKHRGDRNTKMLESNERRDALPRRKTAERTKRTTKIPKIENCRLTIGRRRDEEDEETEENETKETYGKSKETRSRRSI